MLAVSGRCLSTMNVALARKWLGGRDLTSRASTNAPQHASRRRYCSGRQDCLTLENALGSPKG